MVRMLRNTIAVSRMALQAMARTVVGSAEQEIWLLRVRVVAGAAWQSAMTFLVACGKGHAVVFQRGGQRRPITPKPTVAGDRDRPRPGFARRAWDHFVSQQFRLLGFGAEEPVG